MQQIYLGRIVAVAVTPGGRAAALYRVSSRSFPNRRAEIAPDGRSVAIVPKPGFEKDSGKNPYTAYNCARIARGRAVLANGSHADPIAEKILMGMPARDALALSLLAMDYEKDGHSTPRIAAVAEPEAKIGWLGTVREDGLDVRSFSLPPGTLIHLSTYGHHVPSSRRVSEFTAETASEACEFIMGKGVFGQFSNPVAAVAAVRAGESFELAALDG
ncbi:MAG: IMP cyclohydrolase [Planctomycetota bacterium]|jgi:IMP cyclohydrolase|nr:IMP cyclohydrolase [Planctomycetota bacterium]